MENLNTIIGNNIKNLRKSNNMTQLELAEKLNYSNKAISRWESGEVVPDVPTLQNLSKIFNIDIADFFKEIKKVENIKTNRKKISRNKIIITALAVLLVWLIATIAFVYSVMTFNDNLWIVFIWAIPCSCIVSIVFNSIWGKKSLNFIIISVLIWSLLGSLYLTFLKYNLWLIFLIGIPVQIGTILWSKLKLHPKNKKCNEIIGNNTNE